MEKRKVDYHVHKRRSEVKAIVYDQIVYAAIATAKDMDVVASVASP